MVTIGKSNVLPKAKFIGIRVKFFNDITTILSRQKPGIYCSYQQLRAFANSWIFIHNATHLRQQIAEREASSALCCIRACDC